MERASLHPIVLGLAVAAAVPVLASCAKPPEAPAAPTRLHPPELAVADDPSWTGRRNGDPAVATVGGIPIPAERYRRALRIAGPGTDPKDVLNDLVARELLAQEAVRSEGGRQRVPEGVYGKALVSRWLRLRLVDGFSPADVPMEDLQEVFRSPQVSGKFNHIRLFHVLDYQWICCDGNARNCTTPDAETCFAEGTAAMDALRQVLAAAPPDADDIPLLVEKWRVQAPRVSFQEYDFAYDDDRAMQRGSISIDPPVVDEVRRTPQGRFADKVVRSRYGLHILYVREMIPPVRKGLGDPDVRREVSGFFFPRFQQKRLLGILASLLPTQAFRMLGNAVIDNGGHPPRYPVELFVDALNQAMEADLRKKETEPL